MEKHTGEPNTYCLICFSDENNTILTIVNSRKMLENCETYLDISIIIKSFENEAAVSCCRYCYETSHQLTLLEEKAQRIQKEISDLSFSFSKNVLERRSGSNTIKDKSSNQRNECVEFENVNVKKEVIESGTKEWLSETQILTGREKLVTDLLYDSDGCENVAQYNCEANFIHLSSEDDCDIKHSYDEAVSGEVGTAIPNIARNQLSAAIALSDPQTTKIFMPDLLKCLKTPIIQLEKIQPCRNRNSSNIVSGAVNKNEKCEKQFEVSSERNNFAETLSEELSFTCFEASCGKSFKSNGELARHRKNHSEQRPYQCSVCTKSYKRSDKLKAHESVHSGEKPYQCSFCSKSFRRSDHLKDHERIHSGQKPYACSICPKSYLRKSHLEDHNRIHSGERPFKCSFCPKTFLMKHHLETHNKIHSGKRPYMCSICRKSFASKGDLVKHEKIHTDGEKPYTCSMGSKSFITADTLKEHEVVHTGKETFKCPPPHCKESFQREDLSTSHVQRKHGHENEEFILS